MLCPRLSPRLSPVYPVVQYSHNLDDEFFGDSITSGYVYRGSSIPQLYGKYIFGDITTGQLFYADFAEMLAADDGDPSTLAEIRSISVLWNNPAEPAEGEVLYDTMFPIVTDAYHARGGEDPDLPGSAASTSGEGRADIRIQIDANGELFILSKSDGMIRALFAPQSGVAGDYDNNGMTEQGDLDLVLLHWGDDASTLPLDWNHERPADGIVGQEELDRVLLNWGESASQGSTALPEPNSLWMIALLARMLAARRFWVRVA